MFVVALKGLAGRKLRAALTAVAIVLGVAMISGTFVLTDTIKAAFSTVFTTVYSKTDAVVTGKNSFGNSNTSNNLPPSFPESLLGQVRRLPGVEEAEGGISDTASLVGRDGKVISGHGAPSLAFSVHPDNQRFNPLTLVSGTWPVGPHEVAIDEHTASSAGYKVGQSIGVIARGPVEQYRIAGIVKIGTVSSLGGATMAIFDFPTAQKIFHKEGKLDQIDIAAASGTSPEQLVNEVKPLLPPTAEVRTGQGQAAQATKDTNGFLSIINDFLLAFGGVALFVGAFVIANTLSITIAQRTRELATLRTLGASRRQVLLSVMLEALVIGIFASVTGLFLGLALAKGLNWVFVHVLQVSLPQTGTVFATRTIIVALVVGVLVTLIAALRPAIRATRVAPISAVREGAVLPTSRFARFSAGAALLTIGGAVALMLVGLFVHGLTTTQRLLALGVGAAAVFVGVAMLAKTLVPPLARALGWPATQIGGAAGELARGNSMRNPQRTASTASALMIGLALVTLVSVLATGLKTTFNNAVDSVFRGDYAVTATDNFSPFPASSAQALRTVPGVTVVTGVLTGDAKALGSKTQLAGVSGDISKVITVDWEAGSQATPGQLGQDGTFVSKSYAKANNLAVGSALDVEVPSGQVMHLRVRGIYAPPKGGNVYGDVAISTQRFLREYQNPEYIFAFANVAGGVTPANTARLTSALQPFPDAKVATAAEFKKNQEAGINSLLKLLYLLLSLSILISLFGIVNTLVLTVFERTRELGMLRAIGMTRRQVRRMIRHESIITALIGAALGIPLGVVLAWMVGQAINFAAFTIPWVTLILFVIAAIAAGLLAAIFPARRAGKLNVLEALQYE